MEKPIITVVGSINMDLVVTAMKRPEAGETILGNDFYTSPGGKGANQAVAASRLGAEVHMIGRVGDDEFGSDLINFLERENIFLSGVEPVTHKASGVAMITLADGDNSIIVYQGANLDTTPEYIRKYESLIAKSDVVVTQLEIPIESVEETARLCQKHNTHFILNPAPAADVSTDLIAKTSFVTPNQLERTALSEKVDMNQFLEKLIVTEGKDGVVYYEQQKQHRIPSYSVSAVDTTGAGDTFNGAFAYAIGMKEDVKTACHFANAAAALSVQKIGAQAGMPTKEEVYEFIRNNG
ncbi:ribokinase [Sporosarcina jiandibaonis]|uniref:ribokinase n=1 Tax=Sporosarcina jiandibaonis TaxID=2715535 RepID=UPI001551AEB2|nr:ribokinase [Sporosarcina jiandibaonis]